MNERILISACLLGRRVRYDGGSNPLDSSILSRWQDEGRLIAHCPEVAGGLGTPRPAAEIVGGDGADVLDGRAQVLTREGADVTAAFVAGAEAALALATRHGARIAILKARSPSCGSGVIYDGTYSRKLRAGDGVTTALLQRHGIAVFGEDELETADQYLWELRE